MGSLMLQDSLWLIEVDRPGMRPLHQGKPERVHALKDFDQLTTLTGVYAYTIVSLLYWNPCY